MSRETFAVVVSSRERLSVAGSPETVAKIVPKYSPRAILPGDWPEDEMGGWDWFDGAITLKTLPDLH